MKVWGMILAAFVMFAACGEVEDASKKAKGKIATQMLEESLETTSSFKATLANSPLGLPTFDGRLHYIRISEPRVDAMEKTYKVDIKSGGGTLNFGLGARNYLQGVSLVIQNWNGKIGTLPILNPQERPSDGSAYAVVAYSEIEREGANGKDETDWYTYLTLDGSVTITAVDLSARGGVRGVIEYDVLLVEPDKPRPSMNDIPMVRFEGTFNIRSDSSIEQLLFQ